MDLIGSLSPETQLELLEKGRSIFEDIFGTTPIAFRAGCYGASMSTLTALEKIGIRYDSSFNSAYLGSTCLMNARSATNTPWRTGSLWEIPVTTFETDAWGKRGLKPFEVSAISLREMTEVLEQSECLGQNTVIVMLHSFAFLKRADLQFRRMRPDHLVIERFRGLCSFLRRNRDRFQTRTFSSLSLPAESLPQRTPLPRMGLLIPACRKLVQAVNRIYWL